MTNEDLDKARAEEAYRIHAAGDFMTAMEAAARLAREGWQPTPAVDPLVEALREIDPDEMANETDADNLRRALASRGLEIVEIAREDKSAECRGIEIALLWCFKHGNFTSTWAYDQARRDLLGEN